MWIVIEEKVYMDCNRGEGIIWIVVEEKGYMDW